MFATLLGALGSAGLGTITGLLGSGINKVFGLIEKKQQRKDDELARVEAARVRDHEAVMADKAAALAQGNALAQQQLAAMTQASAERAALAQSTSDERMESMRNAQAERPAQWVENVKSLMRPVLTTVLLALVGYIWHSLRAGDTIPTSAALLASIVDTVIYLAATATTWWFGDRAPASAVRR